MVLKRTISRPFGFSILFGLFCLAMGVNFFLTVNPYAAHHSGGAVRWMETHSSNWALHVGILMTSAVIITSIVIVRYLSLTSISMFAVAGILIISSGIASSAIRSFPLSYGFNAFCFAGVGLIAFNDARKFCYFNGRRFITLVLLAYILGIILALIRPEIWGWIPFEFSRSLRGEVTFASIMALPLILTTGLVAFKQTRTLLFVLVIASLAIVEFSFSTRKTIWMIIFPVVVGIAFWGLNRSFIPNRKQKAITILVVFFYFFAFFISIYLVVGYFSQPELEAFLNARLPLWQFHWQLFLEKPLFGVGIFPTQRFLYSGKAFSEIGLLAAFSGYGLLFGFFQVFVVLRALKRSVAVLLYDSKSELAKFCGLVVIIIIPWWFFGECWRIINALDLLFWYSVFYLNFFRSLFSVQAGGNQNRMCNK